MKQHPTSKRHRESHNFNLVVPSGLVVAFFILSSGLSPVLGQVSSTPDYEAQDSGAYDRDEYESCPTYDDRYDDARRVREIAYRNGYRRGRAHGDHHYQHGWGYSCQHRRVYQNGYYNYRSSYGSRSSYRKHFLRGFWKGFRAGYYSSHHGSRGYYNRGRRY